MVFKSRHLIDKFQNILVLFYLILFYSFGADPKKVIYSEIVIFIFMIIEILVILKKHSKTIKINTYIYFWLIFVLFCFVSSFWAFDFNAAITRVKTLSLLVVFMVLLYNYYDQRNDGIELLLKNLMYAGVVFSVYVILFYGGTNYFIGLLKGLRMGNDISNENLIGLQVSISILVSLYFFHKYKEKKYLLYIIIPFIVAMGTGSRKVVILISLSFVLAPFITSYKENFLKFSLKYICIILLFIYAVILLQNVPIFSTTFKRFGTFLNIFSTEYKVVDHSTLERKAFIKAGLDTFYEYPFSGIGIANTFVITREVSGWSTYLHNNFVELLASVGIFGFLFYYIVWILLAKNLYVFSIKGNNKSLSRFCFIFLIILLILDYGVVTYYSKSTFIYACLFMLVVNKNKGVNVNENN